MTSTKTDEFDGIWLDTNILISFLSGKSFLTDKMQLNVKKVLLYGHTIRVSTLALQELAPISGITRLKNIENQIKSLFEPAPVLFYEPPLLTIEQMERTGVRVLPDHKINYQRLSHNDKLMIIQSVLSGCPILSEDKVLIDAIQNVGKQFRIPFPVDEKKLEKVKIEDILSTPGSMRSILIDLLRNIEKTSDLKLQEELLAQKVSDLLQKNKVLSDIAKPNASKTILWTLFEITTSLLPIPIPSTPIASYLQFRRYKKTLRE